MTRPAPADLLPQGGHGEDVAAAVLAAAVRGGDLAAVRRHVHQLEHGGGAVSPWRLIEHLAARLA